MSDLLESVRVVEIGGGMAGPMAGMVLADYGADVVKIETPEGDWAREQPGFAMWNRGKRSVALDPADAADWREAGRLLATADAVIACLHEDSLIRLGADAASVQAINPSVVHCTIGGLAGQGRSSVGYEGCVAAAVGQLVGLDEVQGRALGSDPSEPIHRVVPINAYGASQLAVQGILAALLQREATGAGQRVRTSLAQGAMALMMRQDLHDESRPEALAHDLVHAGIRLTFLTVECSDGRWIQMCARQDRHFEAWLRAVGLEDALDDPRYANGPLRIPTIADIDELAGRIRARMRERTQAEWMRTFIDDYDVGADPVLEAHEFLDHPQMRVNELVVEVGDDDGPAQPQPAPLARFRSSAIEAPRPAPPLGSTVAHELWTGENPRGAEPAPVARLPLDGVTILEIAYFLAAPLGPAILAELGARVIKVEPLAGDPWRRVGLEAVHLLHGKESIALDLKAPGGRDVLEALIARADVLLTNFRPGVPDRLGFGADDALAINESLVYVHATSYGSRGPEARRAAFHSTPNALNGAAILQAGTGNPPVDDSYPDPVAGLAVGTAIMLGLTRRRHTGAGVALETAMLTSAGYAASNLLLAPDPPANDAKQRGTSALNRLYRCATGWVFVEIHRERDWRRLARAIDRADWLDDERFDSPAARRLHDELLVRDLSAVFAGATADEWAERMAADRVPVAAVNERGQRDYYARAGLLRHVRHPAFGEYNRLVARVDVDAPARLDPPPSIGEHTEAILAELGYDADAVERLRDDGAVAGPDLDACPRERDGSAA